MAVPKRVPVPSAKPPKPAARPAPQRATAPQKPEKPKAEPRPKITKDSKLRVLVAGASGMIGTELRRQLADAGHTVLTLVRRPPQRPDEYTWAPDAKILDFRLLEDVDAVVNLSGASLTRVPWTPGWKREILRSRVKATEALVEAMTMAGRPPAVFLSGSAVGFYGARPGETLTEESARGTGFLSDVVAEWEAAARLAPAATRTVQLRTGVVVGSAGAMKPLRLLTKLGVSGPL
ncbi:MAG TPA: NAD-dependent epimerase/dehydratase family protein, partial [Naasia sp.]